MRIPAHEFSSRYVFVEKVVVFGPLVQTFLTCTTIFIVNAHAPRVNPPIATFGQIYPVAIWLDVFLALASEFTLVAWQWIKNCSLPFLWRKKDVILTVNSVLADSLLIAWCQSLWCWDLKHHLFPLGQSGTTSTSTLQLAMFWISFPFGTKCIVFCTCLLLTYQSVLFLCQFFSF